MRTAPASIGLLETPNVQSGRSALQGLRGRHWCGRARTGSSGRVLVQLGGNVQRLQRLRQDAAAVRLLTYPAAAKGRRHSTVPRLHGLQRHRHSGRRSRRGPGDRWWGAMPADRACAPQGDEAAASSPGFARAPGGRRGARPRLRSLDLARNAGTLLATCRAAPHGAPAACEWGAGRGAGQGSGARALDRIRDDDRSLARRGLRQGRRAAAVRARCSPHERRRRSSRARELRDRSPYTYRYPSL